MRLVRTHLVSAEDDVIGTTINDEIVKSNGVRDCEKAGTGTLGFCL